MSRSKVGNFDPHASAVNLNVPRRSSLWSAPMGMSMRNSRAYPHKLRLDPQEMETSECYNGPNELVDL